MWKVSGVIAFPWTQEPSACGVSGNKEPRLAPQSPTTLCCELVVTTLITSLEEIEALLSVASLPYRVDVCLMKNTEITLFCILFVMICL